MTQDAVSSSGWKWLVRPTLAILLAALFLVGLIWAGQYVVEQLRGQDRYTISFSEIECPPVAGAQRRAFLEDVQYLGQLPDRLSLLDKDLADRLKKAFALHPRVQEVVDVHIEAPRTVRVRLRLRSS